MKYKVEFTKYALKCLKKLDYYTQKILITWIENNLNDCENPHYIGKSLKGNKSGEWRYRVGDYRIIAIIEDGILRILVIAIGHRKNIFK